MPLGAVLPDTRLAIDTNILTYWENQQVHIKERISAYLKIHAQLPALTAATVFESFWGFESKAAKIDGLSDKLQRAYSNTKQLIEQCEVLPLNQQAATLAAHIAARIGGSKANQLRYDIFVATTAIAHDFGVATANQEDFEIIAQHLPTEIFLRLSIWKPGR
jgi:predicted nucleic acid-binding protein